MSWDFTSIKDVIQSIGVIFTICLSIFAIIRSSKVQQNAESKAADKLNSDNITKIKDELTAHILDDSKIQSELRTEVTNLKESVSEKLSDILDKLDE